MTVRVGHAIGVAAFCSWTVAALALECSVAVDVGHFLARPGTTSARGRTEFEFNVELARAINSVIEQRGCRVTLIGERGDVADLKERTARAQGAALFLSVHHDSTAERFLERWVVNGVARSYTDRIAGFSLFVSHANAHSMRSLRCASAIGARLRANGFAPSLFHADPAFGEVRPFADSANGVHWFDDLVVLKTATQPAVLLEAGVLVNRAEEILLQRSDVRERIAVAVVDGALACVRDRP
jgi:N-acetylmuramoyl-L-alanine amidase